MIVWLKEYTLTLCTAVFFITAVELILPDNSIKKYARFVMGLILITIIINPVIKLYNKNFNFDVYVNNAAKYMDDKKYEDNYKKYKDASKDDTMKIFNENIEKECIKKLEEKFPGNSFIVNVKTTYDTGNSMIAIDKVSTVVSSGKVKKVVKININSKKKTEESQEVLNSPLATSIKQYLSGELNIPDNKITVFKK